MNGRELKGLNRNDLLEMLLTLRKENDQLREQVSDLKKQLETRKIEIDNSGSLAEAVLRLNGVYKATQAACEQYVENVRMRMEQQKIETKKQCEQMLARASQEVEAYPWLKDIIDDSNTRDEA